MWYEMFDQNGIFTSQVQEAAARFLDLPDVDPKPGNLKMNPEPLSELVENFEDLRNCLAASKHQWMLSGDG